MIAGNDFLRLARRLVEENKVLHKVHEVTLVADALEQRLHVHDTRFFFGQPLPFVKVLPLAGNATDLRLLAVTEHHHRVVVEDMGNGVAVVRVVLLKSSPEVPVDVLALDEEQWQTVDEADDVCPAAIEVTFDPQLADTKEMVVFGCLEVEDSQPLPYRLAFVVVEGDEHAVADQVVLLTVGGNDGL